MRIAFDIYETGDRFEEQGIELGYFDIEFQSLFLKLLAKYDIDIEKVEEYITSYLYDNASKEIIYAKTYREGKNWLLDYTLRINCEIPFKGFKKELNDIILYTSSDFKSYASDDNGISDIEPIIKGIREKSLSKEKTYDWLDKKWKNNVISRETYHKVSHLVHTVKLDDFPFESIKQTSRDYYYTVSQSIKDNIEFYEDILGDDFYSFFDELEEEERNACYPNNLVG